MNRLTAFFILLASLASAYCCSGCDFLKDREQTVTVTDQLGRTVDLPARIEKICALHHFGGKIVYALKQQDRLVDTSIYGKEALALKAIDPEFAAKPAMLEGHSYNVEGLMKLGPQMAFVYASSNQAEMEIFSNAGIPVVAVKGETFEQSFDAIRLMASVLQCETEGDTYITACRDLIAMVRKRIEQQNRPPIRVLFSGPKSIYSAATGSMLQTEILALSGAVNVARDLTGFWADISPEQIAVWDPEVVFLGSSLDSYGRDHIYGNPHFSTVTAIRNRQVYSFPSNVGWWDYPAPHCVLGVVWSAKTLYPDLFSDVDMMTIANRFYERFMGHTFEALGGMLD